MRPPAINLRDVVIVIADPNGYLRRIVAGMLRGFGANKVLEADDARSLLRVLGGQKIDILLCDARLAPQDGLAVTRAIRRNPENENRAVPILLMTGDCREATVKRARDAGVNLVIAKPMSPAALYHRLAWIAADHRPFIDAPNYFGPDRRFRIEGYPDGVGRRKGDQAVAIIEEAGPALAQDDIDSLFSASRVG